MGRVFDRFSLNDLHAIQKYSLIELERFYNKAGNPPGKFKILENELIAICLCQGVAQHYIESLNTNKFNKTVLVSDKEIQEKGYKINKYYHVLSGVRDIDIWFFFKECNFVKIPDIRNCRKSINVEFTHFGIRKLDFLKKTIKNQIIKKAVDNEPHNIIKSYLMNDTNKTPNFLSLKSVVGLYPDYLYNKLIWKVNRIKENSK